MEQTFAVWIKTICNSKMIDILFNVFSPNSITQGKIALYYATDFDSLSLGYVYVLCD